MWLEIQIFGFQALWSPYFFTYVFALGLLYFLITGPLRHNFGDHAKPTVKQQTMFYVGLLVLYIAKGSPIDLLSHIMLTTHMIQMAIYLLVFPVLVIKGIPAWVWEKVIYKPIIRPLFKLFTKPLIAILLFNLMFSMYHMPSVFDFSKSSQVAHTSINIIILIAAFNMWWPIVTPVKDQNKMKPLLKIGYMFANGALITPACVLIIFSSSVLFAAYSSEGAWLQALSLCVPGNVLDGLAPELSGAEMFSPLSAYDDQQLGAIIMKIFSEIVYGTMIGRIFFKWFKKSKSNTIDPLPADSF